MRTFSARAQDIERRWYVVDAEGKTLGRLATEIARILRGKHKPIYTPHVDCGDFVIVVNAGKVRTTGRKEAQKTYWRHSGYPGGLTLVPLWKMRRTHPERIIEHAVRGMLPRGPLGRRMLRKLKVYAGPEHPHAAQKPEKLEISA